MRTVLIILDLVRIVRNGNVGLKRWNGVHGDGEMSERQRKWAPRSRLEQDGLFLEEPEQWEMWRGGTYIKRKQNGAIRRAILTIPNDIVRHLNLRNKQKVMVAIKVLPDE